MNDEPLMRALQGCSLHAFLILVSRALTRAGFGEVQMLDRRQSREKSRYGGHDLVCHTDLGTLPTKVIVKVILDSARLRMLDELVGAVIRMRADAGLLVTPFGVTAGAASAEYGVPRVSILSGPDLAAMVREQGIGLRGDGLVDYEFFGYLEEASEKMLNFIRESSLA